MVVMWPTTKRIPLSVTCPNAIEDNRFKRSNDNPTERSKQPVAMALPPMIICWESGSNFKTTHIPIMNWNAVATNAMRAPAITGQVTFDSPRAERRPSSITVAPETAIDAIKKWALIDITS